MNISYSQVDTTKNNPVIGKDSVIDYGTYSQKLNGIFVSPFMGLEWPVKVFNNTSKSAFTYGIKLEFAGFKLYPVILGLIYKYQKNPGKDDFMTAQLLNTFDTKISSFGITADILLNKYIHSNFTLPFLTLEVKYLSVQRIISPDIITLNYKTSDNLIGITAGAGFTLSIFDIYGGYTFAKDYSSAEIMTRIHFALIKF
jgi:hypothetical protein